MTVQSIKTKNRKLPAAYKAARFVCEPIQILEPLPPPPLDFAKAERRAFIDGVHPFTRPGEKARYLRDYALAVMFGVPMPYERRKVK